MHEPERPAKRGFLASFFQAFDLARRLVVNLVFLVVLLLLWALVSDGVPTVPDSTVLVVSPRGVIVEQLSGDPVDRALDELTGKALPETLLKDLVDAIELGRDDERVKALYLDLHRLVGAALPKLRAVRAAVEDFRQSGKPVIAAADFYNNARYHLATGADEIYLHPLGAVMLEGYGRYRSYYKEGLDRYGVEWNVFRVGDYKSAVEPYTRDSMSDEARDANSEFLDELWSSYLDDVASARELQIEQLVDFTDRFHEALAEDGGNTAALAQRFGLVDHLAHADALRERLIETAGEDEETHSFHRIDHDAYLLAAAEPEDGNGEVAVIVARGTILPGDQPPGTIGGRSTAALIRQARHDEDVKAVVLRVDSGGGSAFASEVIRREFELMREAGKPVVVSMGSVAASGGYWIATASDEIWAEAATITGSIGIFGYFPTFQRPLAQYLGVHVDGVETTWLAGVRPDRPLPEEMRTSFQLMIEQGYRDFLERVGTARGMSLEEVDDVGQGHVWTGTRALEKGLVDRLGSLEDAVASAAALAELGEDYGVRYLEKEQSLKDEMLIGLLARAQAFYRPGPAVITDPFANARRFFLEELELFALLQDPKGIYAHCLCEVE